MVFFKINENAFFNTLTCLQIIGFLFGLAVSYLKSSLKLYPIKHSEKIPKKLIN